MADIMSRTCRVVTPTPGSPFITAAYVSNVCDPEARGLTWNCTLIFGGSHAGRPGCAADAVDEPNSKASAAAAPPANPPVDTKAATTNATASTSKIVSTAFPTCSE
ncbi:hypothetical protein D9M69_640130 [compost metagenome]